MRPLTFFLIDIVTDACKGIVDVEFDPPLSFKAVSQSGKKRSNDAGLYCHCEASSSADNAREEMKLKSCVKRFKLATRQKLYHVCLNEHGGRCKFKIRCSIGNCRESHNPLMHPIGIELSAHIRTNCTVLFRIVPVQLY